MSRSVVLAAALAAGALAALAGCSKSAGNQDPIKSAPAPSAAETERIAAPGEVIAAPGGARAGGDIANDPAFRLSAEEGSVAVEVAPPAAPGAETTAKIVVTPGPKYKVNVEYPTKLTLDAAPGVTLAKAAFTAGGADKAKGDADQFDEKQLTFSVKLTPTAAGTYTVNGTFKFAVCDKDQCLPKKEPIAIQVAAN